MVQRTDVLIVGAGSAGLCAATWLARYGVPFRLLERRAGPLATGQADGVQCRTVEVFESLGIGEELVKEAYHVLEVAFWAPAEAQPMQSSRSPKEGIVRTRTAPDTPRGLSHLPHVILNQARVNGLLIGAVRAAGGPEIEYGWEVRGVRVDEGEAGRGLEGFPVGVVAERGGVVEEVRAKYVLVSSISSLRVKDGF